VVDVHPFRALRADEDFAPRVLTPSFSALSAARARSIASDPASFVHVTRPEVHFPPEAKVDPDTRYQASRTHLERLISQHILRREGRPTYYVYRLRSAARVHVGFFGAVPVKHLESGLVLPHEHTRTAHEADRTRHMELLRAQVDPVFLTHRQNPAIQGLLEKVQLGLPRWQVKTSDGVEHTLWTTPPELLRRFRRAFETLDKLYIADGHHRSAAALRLHKQWQTYSSATFLAAVFSEDQLDMRPFHRIVSQVDVPALLEWLRERFPVQIDADGPVGLYANGRWYGIDLGPEPAVVALQHKVLAPGLHIENPRTSPRLQHVPDTDDRVLEAAAEAVGGVAFRLPPPSIQDVFDTADQGKVMPPKSTWIGPKLREGVVLRVLDA